MSSSCASTGQVSIRSMRFSRSSSAFVFIVVVVRRCTRCTAMTIPHKKGNTMEGGRLSRAELGPATPSVSPREIVMSVARGGVWFTSCAHRVHRAFEHYQDAANGGVSGMKGAWAAMFLLASVAFAQAQDAQDPVKRGEALLEKNCGMCHAIGRTGGSPKAEAPPFRTLGQRYAIESLE